MTKHEKFLQKLLIKNKHYEEGLFEVISFYKFSKEKIQVKTKYGICEVKPNVLLDGGMPGIRSAVNKTDYIVNRFKEIWGDRYNYSKFEYLGSGKKSTIICKKHGEFECTMDNHIWRKAGCPKCGDKSSKEKRTLTVEQFTEKAKEVHGDKYDYSKVDYSNGHNKIEIICKEHGSFWQAPYAHLYNKNGCPICNSKEGYHTKESWCNTDSKRGTLYLIELQNETERFLKIGITKNTVKQRFKGKKAMPYTYKIITEVKTKNKELIWDVEKQLHNDFKEFKYKPKILFGGAYECFDIKQLNNIYEQFKRIFKLTKE